MSSAPIDCLTLICRCPSGPWHINGNPGFSCMCAAENTELLITLKFIYRKAPFLLLINYLLIFSSVTISSHFHSKALNKHFSHKEQHWPISTASACTQSGNFSTNIKCLRLRNVSCVTSFEGRDQQRQSALSVPKPLSLPSAFTKCCFRATELVQHRQVNLKIEITEVPCLNPHICLNYGSLGRNQKSVWSPEGWWAPREVHTRDVHRQLCPGPAPVGSPLGHLPGRGTVDPGLTQPLPRCASAKPQRFWGIRAEPNQAEPKASTAWWPGSHKKPAWGTVSTILGTAHF